MARVNKVFKYPTGAVIPPGAVYLSTQVETFTNHYKPEENLCTGHSRTENEYVWHYFLVEVDE